MAKGAQEIRDPVHVFVRIESDERAIVDSPFFQRLRHLHQLALTCLLYPGATHRRFEHSLGAMELAGRVFDVVTSDQNLRGAVRDIMPDPRELPHWRRAVRMGALCHDIGHLPFSHGAEGLLPPGWSHERLSKEIIGGPPFRDAWNRMTPPLRADDVVKIAVGPGKAADQTFTAWESLMADIVVGDAFGVDRMDYLLRDSVHTGVAYGRFDHYRLIDTLRIVQAEEGGEPALGIAEGGLQSAEALIIARYFMFSQVYLHPVRRVYDIHLQDFLREWLPNGRFSTELDDVLNLTDNDVLVAINAAARDRDARGHDPARRIVQREHFRLLYSRSPQDLKINPNAAQAVFKAAEGEFGPDKVRRDFYTSKNGVLDFPVLQRNGGVGSSTDHSETLARTPVATAQYVFIAPEVRTQAEKWLHDNRDAAVRAGVEEEKEE
jgi:HD superfamily phosphohydrolase